jgi:hypothetical protein
VSKHFYLLSPPSRKPDKLFLIVLAKRSGVSAERRQPDGAISDGGFLPKAATPPKTISPFRPRAFLENATIA